MAEKLALVVSDPCPYTADLRADFVDVVIEFEAEQDRPHNAIVETHGVCKGDRVKVVVETRGIYNSYRIVEKVDPPTPDSGESTGRPVSTEHGGPSARFPSMMLASGDPIA